MKHTTARKGFTLVEIVVVLGIMSLVMMGISRFLIDTAQSSFITAEKLDINADVRQFTLDMAENARAANYFFIYNSFQQNDRDDPSDRLRDGSHGDFLLLVYVEPWPNVNSPDHYTRVVGYFREADPTNPNSEGPVMRVEKFYHNPTLAVTPAGSSGPFVSSVNSTVEDLLDSLSYNGTYPTVVQLSRGLANGQLFYNYLDRSIMIKAQIIHGNVAKRITDTYNYTVSPRG